MAETDRILRAMTNDGAFRVMVARTTDTARGAIEAQKLTPQTAGYFGDLLTGAILYRETMAPTLRVQCIVQGSGDSGHMVADSHPDGWARGLVQVAPAADAFALGGGAMLKMMRTMPKGDLHQGTVLVPKGDLSAAFMAYYERSEQIESMISVATRMVGEHVVAAAGYLVQLLPEAPEAEGAVATMRARHASMGPLGERLLDDDASPDALLETLLEGMPWTRLDDSPLRFECNCSRVRVLTSLSTIGRKELESIVVDGEPLDMSCDYCGTEYIVTMSDLAGLLDAS